MKVPGNNGASNNGTGGSHDSSDLPDLLKERFPLMPSPEQGCYGCLIGIALIVVSVLFWAFIYWKNNPELHTP